MADLNALVDQLSELTVLEAAELSKLLEEKWGVSAAAAVAVAAPGAGGAGGAAPAEEAKDEVDVILTRDEADKDKKHLKDPGAPSERKKAAAGGPINRE